MKHAFLFFALVVTLAACADAASSSDQSNSTDSAPIPANTTPASTPTATTPNNDTVEHDATRAGKDGQVVPQNDSIVRFMVSFISKGFGIDHDSKDQFDQWLRNRKDIKYTASPWGKEGEWSYCFPLKNKSAAEQEQFMRDVKNLLTKRDLIVFSENIVCEKRR